MSTTAHPVITQERLLAIREGVQFRARLTLPSIELAAILDRMDRAEQSVAASEDTSFNAAPPQDGPEPFKRHQGPTTVRPGREGSFASLWCGNEYHYAVCYHKQWVCVERGDGYGS